MIPFINWDEVPEREIMKGFHGRLVHTDTMTFARWRIEKGSEVPLHQHHHEQITYVLEGRLEMTVGAHSQVCENSGPVLIPSNVPHRGVALTDCVVLDVFQPTRDDYR